MDLHEPEFHESHDPESPPSDLFFPNQEVEIEHPSTTSSSIPETSQSQSLDRVDNTPSDLFSPNQEDETERPSTTSSFILETSQSLDRDDNTPLNT